MGNVRLICPVTEEPCANPSCKKSLCATELAEYQEIASKKCEVRETKDAYVRNNLDKECKEVARDALRLNRRPVTQINIAIVSKNEKVREIAKKRLVSRAEVIYSGHQFSR